MLRRLAASILRPELSTLSESVRIAEANQDLLRERLAELELALDDEGWRRLSGEGQREFSREGLAKIIQTSRLMFLKNPLINRAVTLQSIYVWAQGATIAAADPYVDEVVQKFLADPKNQAELSTHQARTMKEQDLQVLGNLFFAFFTDIASGAVRLRTIPVDEIDEIVCNPDDSKESWYYKRSWTQRALNIVTGVEHADQRTAYYPDVQYAQSLDIERVPSIGRSPVLWDTPVYHVRVGGLSDMRFGVPETYQAIDWARAYKAFLEDWASIVRAHRRFAWQGKIEGAGGAKAVAAVKAKLNTTTGTGNLRETNPAPNVASTFIGSGVDLQPIRTAGATTSAEDGRRLLLMVCAAAGLPESFFGDVSVGTLATARSLDRPTELKFRDRQELWRGILTRILNYVVEASINAVSGRLRGRSEIDRSIDVNFPPILEHDVNETVQAWVRAATLDGKPLAGTMDLETVARGLLTSLSVANVEELLDNLPDQPMPAAAVSGPGVAEALRELRAAVVALRESIPAEVA